MKDLFQRKYLLIDRLKVVNFAVDIRNIDEI